ncbi:MAG: carbohydrate binding family 9 domain-containing protein [Gemmatimonadales bacterium]
MSRTAFGGPAIVLLAASLALARPGAVRAQDRGEKPAKIELVPVATAPRIDGRLDEPYWREAAIVPLAWEWFPGDNTAPPVATSCRLLAGPDALYVGCRASDPAPGEIRAHYAERDEAGGDDLVSVLLDPTGTRRRGYRFSVTALGVQYDALYDEDDGDDETWDATWPSAARIGPDGYVVELAIPYRALRRPRPAGETVPPWGLVIERRWPRSAAYRIGAMPLDRDDSCLLCQAREVAGLDSVPTGRGAWLQPTLTASRTEEDDSSGMTAATSELSPGLSGRWSPSASARLAFTANPDFSQVEADAAEFEVNRRFALSFPEKRPFFLDDADFFDVDEDLLFTRSVVDPLGGGKLTWQQGRRALGTMATVDGVNSRILPGNQSSERVSTDADVTGLVGRYRVDLAGSSAVGFLGTARVASEYHDVVGGVDGTFRLGRSHRLRFQLAASHADDEPAVEALTGRRGGFAGLRALARYDYDARNWELEAGLRAITAGFRADAGALQRVDLLGPEVQVTRVFRPAEPTWYDVIELDIEGQRLTDFGGSVIDEKLGVGAAWQGPLQSEVEITHAWRREAYGDELFPVRETEVDLSVRPGDLLALSAAATFGDEIDADNARLGRGVEFRVGTELLPGRAVRIALSQRFARLSIDAGEVFRAWLSEARFEYHFGLALFARLVLQYRRVERDPTLWVDPVGPESNRLFVQGLLSYELSPQTVVYAGYAGTTRDFEGLDLAPEQRALFVKLGYGWQF